MPSVSTEGGTVHYEAVGSGLPVLLIHGYTQSWDTWHTTMQAFEDRYRLYAIDLWGFGSSDKTSQDSFKVTDFIDLIPRFMDALGISSIPIMGHSMGGTTALGVAIRYPERVEKVAVVGSPIIGKSLSLYLKLMGFRPFAQVMLLGENKPLMRAFMKLWSANVSPEAADQFYTHYVRNMTYSLDSFSESINSLRKTDLRPELAAIDIPALGIFGDKDVIVNPDQAKVFAQHLPHGQVRMIDGAGHFVMWDKPAEFNEAFIEFMEL